MSPRKPGTTAEKAKESHSELYQAFLAGTTIEQLSVNYGLHLKSVERILRAMKADADREFKRRMKK